MKLPLAHPCVERFPNGWMIRRLDGTIKTIVGVSKGASDIQQKVKALEIAGQMALSPKDEGPLTVNRDLSVPPSMVIGIRRRHRGRAAKPDNQYSIHVSLQVVLFSHSEDSGGRYHRWHKVGLGEMGSLTDEVIRAARERVYGAWAWATHMRSTQRVVDLLKRTVPADTTAFLEMLCNVPAPMTRADIWSEYGFDPLTHTDSKARILDIRRIFSEA